jgi:glycosyltransferase involved in cell wall biosynthesis
LKRNVAFIGVESHFVFTKSSGFIEALRTRLGKLAIFTSEWQWIHLPLKKRWDLVVFWQHFPKRWELDCLDADSVVLVPMLDDCPKHEGFWKPYNDCTVLCFSRTLAELISGFGLRVVQGHYYPAVPTIGAAWNGTGLRVFFWPRKPDLNWSHIRPLVSGTSWERFHVHRTDKLSQVPIDISSEEKRRLSKVLSDHNVFFAPRRHEGIGLSFLEAMSLGMAVVAPDNPTMNEYIQSGESGYLYDPDRPEPRGLEGREELG